MDFAIELRKMRKRVGLTQKALAKKLGTTPQNISQYESGKRNPSIETIKKIATALNAKYTFLKNGDIHFYQAGDLVDLDLFAGEGNPILDLYSDKVLLEHFHKLNESGQEKALDQVELLTKIPDYQK